MRDTNREDADRFCSTSILAATRRDPDGRILAPVKLNGQGPFEFIVNTGAGRSAVSDRVVRRLGLSLDDEPPILVHGVTGSTRVPAVRVESMALGNLRLAAIAVPVIANALGLADGFLSLTDFVNDRILLDMQQDRILLPQGAPPPNACPGAAVLRMDPAHLRAITVDARVHGIHMKAIVDTGAGATLGNLAMYRALTHRVLSETDRIEVVGATIPGRIWKPQPLPALELGSLRILGARIAYGEIPLFEHLRLMRTPAMLLGMDILGQFAGILINFKGKTIQLHPRKQKGR